MPVKPAGLEKPIGNAAIPDHDEVEEGGEPGSAERVAKPAFRREASLQDEVAQMNFRDRA